MQTLDWLQEQKDRQTNSLSPFDLEKVQDFIKESLALIVFVERYSLPWEMKKFITSQLSEIVDYANLILKLHGCYPLKAINNP